MITEYISSFKAIFALIYLVFFKLSRSSFHILGSNKPQSFFVSVVFQNAC